MCIRDSYKLYCYRTYSIFFIGGGGCFFIYFLTLIFIQVEMYPVLNSSCLSDPCAGVMLIFSVPFQCVCHPCARAMLIVQLCTTHSRAGAAQRLSAVWTDNFSPPQKHRWQCRPQHETVHSRSKAETVGTGVGTAVKNVATGGTVGTVREKKRL